MQFHELLDRLIKSPRLDTHIRQVVFDNPNLFFQIDSLTARSVPHHLNALLPGYLAKMLPDQIRGFLNSHSQMNSILEQHSAYLNQLLENRASELLDQMCRDPQYHQLTKRFLESISAQATTQLEDQSREFRTQMNAVENVHQRLASLEFKVSFLSFLNLGFIGVFGVCAYLYRD